jgi:uroporphyrinogen-III decarboxylase
MAGTFQPRLALKEMLEGRPPSRPLFLPILFSLGARIENVPLRAFLGNPTKITSALRQIRGRVPADGVTCYFDPFLEAEALGGTLEWVTEDGPPRLVWPGGVEESGLPRGVRSAEEAAKSGRVPVAVEVIKRMKDAVRDSALLMVGLRGPMALAGKLLRTSSDPDEEGRSKQRPCEEIATAVELAGAALAEIARTLLEAGAHVVMMHEGFAEELPEDVCNRAAEQMETVRNIVRFYEAVLLVFAGGKSPVGKTREGEESVPSEMVLCMEWLRDSYRVQERRFLEANARCGLALPASVFAEGESEYAQIESGIHRAVIDARPAVVTTSSDVPAASDMKRLAQISATVAQAGPPIVQQP